MISVEGAGLIAQVVPVAVLVIAFDARNASERIAALLPRWLAAAIAIITSAIVALAIGVVAVCVWVVNVDVELSGPAADLVIGSSIAIYVVTVLMVSITFGVLIPAKNEPHS